VAVAESDFFREATVRICGSLEIDKALGASIETLRESLPVDAAYIGDAVPEQRIERVLAEATADGARLLDLTIPLSAREAVRVGDEARPEVMVINRPETNPVARQVMEFLDLGADFSMMVLPLIAGQKKLGSVHLLAHGRDRYTEDHARLLELLRAPFTIALSNYLHHREVLALKEQLADENVYLKTELLHQSVGTEIVGADFGLKAVMELARQVAPLSSPVLLRGETGVGKEVIASAIHGLSPRRAGPFVKVNCGAIPETLLDSELFGHEKGAFTGATTDKRGRFERADKGTIFLDEIGELTPEAQVRLLRVLQDKEVDRVGGTRTISVDIRVIAATHRDLEAMVRRESFREDLYFRLQVFPIFIPPLRERKADLPALVQHFVHKKSREMGLRRLTALAPDALERLIAYEWPGNVRELENAVERALIVSKGQPLDFADLTGAGHATRGGRAAVGAPPATRDAQLLRLDDVVSSHIRRVLGLAGGKVEGEGGAAALLDVNPSTLRKRMRKLGIPFGRRAGR
jgi:transcriptional regulator with GAF, ATPase, and Fis domain